MFNQKSFTLIELLVVVSIIGLLSSIVMVSLKGAKEKAQLAKAISYASQVHHALGAYALGVWNFNENASDTCQGSPPNDICDTSGNENHGELKGNTTWSTDTPTEENYSLTFDGNGDYVSGGDVVENENQLTISVWIKPMAVTGTNWFFGEGAAFRIGITATDEITFWLRGDDSGGTDRSDSTTTTSSPITEQKWYHVVGVWDGTVSSRKIYVNGELEEDGTTIVIKFNGDGNNFAIGTGYNGNTSYFNGLMDDVRIYSQPLSAAKVKKIYTEEIIRHELSANR